MLEKIMKFDCDLFTLSYLKPDSPKSKGRAFNCRSRCNWLSSNGKQNVRAWIGHDMVYSFHFNCHGFISMFQWTFAWVKRKNAVNKSHVHKFLLLYGIFLLIYSIFLSIASSFFLVYTYIRLLNALSFSTFVAFVIFYSFVIELIGIYYTSRAPIQRLQHKPYWKCGGHSVDFYLDFIHTFCGVCVCANWIDLHSSLSNKFKRGHTAHQLDHIRYYIVTCIFYSDIYSMKCMRNVLHFSQSPRRFSFIHSKYTELLSLRFFFDESKLQ